MRETVSKMVVPMVAGYEVVRIGLGVLLLTAAALKGHQLATEPVAETGLLTSRWFLIAVVEFELFFGLWLLAGLLPKWTWRATLLCFGGFACMALYKALSGEASCGCFGQVTVDPWHVLGLDVAAVTALLCFRPDPIPPVLTFRNGRLRLLGAGLISLGVVSGGVIAWGAITFDNALANAGGVMIRDEVVILEPGRWVGQEFPLLNYIDLGGRLGEGDWTVMLYHRDCSACREVILQSEDGPLGDKNGRLALVEVPSRASAGGELESLVADRECLSGRLDESIEWFVETPVLVALQKRVVVDVIGPQDLQRNQERGPDAQE